ncbi:MAG: DUF3196 family protein [Mycoplasmataceae bacterium]|jgi:hypothetical protein|nr:DUF3196 family protein [Mycoplasmataceae bacterium]
MENKKILKDARLEKIIKEINDLFNKALYTEGLLKLKNETEGSYIPLSYTYKFEELKSYGEKMEKEKHDFVHFSKLTREQLANTMFKNNKLNVMALLIFFERFKDESTDIFEQFTLSPLVENSEKIYFFKLFDEYFLTDTNKKINIKVFNNKLNKRFIFDYGKEYYASLLKIIQNKLFKNPSSLNNAITVIKDIEAYYFGFVPRIQEEILANDIINYLNGDITKSEGMNIILHSIANEELND